VCNVLTGALISPTAPPAAGCGINSSTFQDHCTMMTFDQCTPGMTFEVEIIRHFEGTTDDESMSL